MTRIAMLGFALALLALAAGPAKADEQPKSVIAMASQTASAWSPVDFNFVAQANLGAPFQIASGRIAEEKATNANIRDYAHLMVVSHKPVVDALDAILQRERVTAPPNTLLQGAYDAMIASLKGQQSRDIRPRLCGGPGRLSEGQRRTFQIRDPERHRPGPQGICTTHLSQDRGPPAAGLRIG